MTIDIAHPPLPGPQAEDALDEALRTALRSNSVRVVKIIHGYGSGGTGGALRTVARNWAYRNRARLHASIPGEEITSGEGLRLAAACGLTPTGDLGGDNPGVTILWVR